MSDPAVPAEAPPSHARQVSSARLPQSRGADASLYLALSSLWLIAILLVDPTGEFAVTDDWAYAGPLREWIAEGRLRMSAWGAMNLVSHLLWGAAFASQFGASDLVLRLSTLVAALLCACALMRILRLMGTSRRIAFLGTLCLVLNPIFFSLSFSFMTDVSYTAMQVGAMWLLIEGMARNSAARLTAGWALTAVALLARQTGLAIAGGFVGEALARRPFRVAALAKGVAALAAFIGLQIGFQLWLVQSGVGSPALGRPVQQILVRLTTDPAEVLESGLTVTIHFLLTLGLFILPLTLLALRRWPGSMTRPRLLLYAAGSIALWQVLRATGFVFPTWGTTFYAFRLGTDLPTAPPSAGAALILMAAAVVSAVLMLAASWHAAGHWRRTRSAGFDPGMFAACTALLLLGFMVLIQPNFDRYVVPILPCAIIVLCRGLDGWRPTAAQLAPSIAAFALIGGFSIAATHDFMAAKRVQTAVYRQLAATVPAETIDGGIALNGPVSFGRHGARYAPCGWYRGPDFVVTPAVDEFSGFDEIARFPVTRWLPWARGTEPIRLLRRADAQARIRREQSCW